MRVDVWKIPLSVLWVMIAINVVRPFPTGMATVLNATGLFRVVVHLGE